MYQQIQKRQDYHLPTKGLGVAYTHAHRGLRDVEITYEVYNRLRKVAQGKQNRYDEKCRIVQKK